MHLPALIDRLDARPFRPFAIITSAGRRIAIDAPRQCAVAPDGALIVVTLAAAGLEVLSIQEIADIADIADMPAAASAAAHSAPPPRAPAAAHHDDQVVITGGNGAVATRPHEAGGVPVVTAALLDSAGRTILDLAATLFDVHAVEAGDNYLTAHMTHPCEPGVVTRVLAWPPGNGSLQTFAEAMPLPALQGVLRGSDEQLRRRPKYPQPDRRYFESLSERDERPHVNESSPEALAPDRFVLHTNTIEIVPGRLVTESRLFDRAAGVPALDLYETGLESTITPPEREGAPWRAAVVVPAAGEGRGDSARLECTFDPRTRRAAVGRRALPASLDWVERIARLHDVFDRPATVQRVFDDGPRPPTEPLARLTRGDDVAVELWPAPARVRHAMLKPRILGPGDTPVLDLRVTQWGGRVMLADPFVLRAKRAHADPHTVTLQLIAESGASPHDLAGTLLAINARTRRVTSPDTPGVTTLGVLQHLLAEFAAPSVLIENLHEAMDAGERVARL